MKTLFDSIDISDSTTKQVYLKPLFGYIGGKSKQLDHIVPYLPYKKRYVEPCGGSAAVLLARNPSPVEVFNDLYPGVVGFYRCIRDEKSVKQIIDWLELTIHSREDFFLYKEIWNNQTDAALSAAMWFYTHKVSFNEKFHYFGRSTNSTVNASKVRNCLPMFWATHKRFKGVKVEMQDAIDCMRSYDSTDTVIYLDPPYIGCTSRNYDDEMTHSQHHALIEAVFRCKGFVAVSGYENAIYNNNPWSQVYTWKTNVSSKARAFTDTNNRSDFETVDNAALQATECLWIKE